MQKLSVSEVTTDKIPNKSEDLMESSYRKCDFCQKFTKYLEQETKILRKLSGSQKFFCEFCVRNHFNNPNNKNVFRFNFRSLIAFFYHENYKNLKNIYLSQLQDEIAMHKKKGLKNPLFFYDDELMNWFVDFSRVGSTPKKIPLRVIQDKIVEILSCFDSDFKINGFCFNLIEKKIICATNDFYQFRKYKYHDKVFSPTLEDLGYELPKSFDVKNSKKLFYSDLRAIF